jgi:hypothetical protein
MSTRAARWLVLGVGALVWVACSLEVTYDGSRFTCADGVCPAGQSCAAGVCEPPDVSDDDGDPPAPVDASVDAPVDATGPGPIDGGASDANTACLLSAIKDDFTDPAIAPMWSRFGTPPPTVSETLGVLLIDMPAGQSGDHYGGYVSSTGDARGQRVYARLVQAPSASTMAQAIFRIEDPADPTRRATVQVEAGMLRLLVNGPSGTFTSTSTYNATQHRYLAIREQGGTLFFESSPSGTAWSSEGMSPTPTSFAAVRMTLGGGTFRAEPAATQARWDEVNGGGAPAGCPF